MTSDVTLDGAPGKEGREAKAIICGIRNFLGADKRFPECCYSCLQKSKASVKEESYVFYHCATLHSASKGGQIEAHCLAMLRVPIKQS